MHPRAPLHRNGSRRRISSQGGQSAALLTGSCADLGALVRSTPALTADGGDKFVVKSRTLIALSVLAVAALGKPNAIIEPSSTVGANDTSIIFVTGTIVSSSLPAQNATITTGSFLWNSTEPTATAACSTFVSTVTSCAYSSAFVSGPVATAIIAGNESWPTTTSAELLNGTTSLSSPNATNTPLAVGGLAANSAGTNMAKGAAVGAAVLGAIAGGMVL